MACKKDSGRKEAQRTRRIIQSVMKKLDIEFLLKKHKRNNSDDEIKVRRRGL